MSSQSPVDVQTAVAASTKRPRRSTTVEATHRFRSEIGKVPYVHLGIQFENTTWAYPLRLSVYSEYS